MNGRTWYAVDVEAEAAAAEAIESAFNIVGSVGTEIDGLRKKQGDPVRVTGFFETKPDETAIHDAIDESLRIYGLSGSVFLSLQPRTVEETDWLAEWKKHWRPTEIGKFIVAPPWEKLDPMDKFLISIDPNMAFGTGTHETTQLCLQAISDRFGPTQTMLDVGTGTGVLAIAAAKIGKKKIIACDTDGESVKIAIENARLNGVSDRIGFFNGSIDVETPACDWVCANLTLDVILPILSLLLSKARQTLLLSGILVEQQPEILSGLARLGYSNPDIAASGEWISVTVNVN